MGRILLIIAVLATGMISPQVMGVGFVLAFFWVVLRLIFADTEE